MHILRHRLTEEEKTNLRNYLFMINSKDCETSKLGGSLFFNDFSKYKCPIVRCNKVYLKKLKFPNNIGYWRQKITDLLYYNYYCY